MYSSKILQYAVWVISLVAIIAGFITNESDLIFAGLIALLIMTVSIFMSGKKGSIKSRYYIPLGVLMIPCIIVNYIDGGWVIHILGTIPVMVALSIAIIGLLIGYCGVRLDRVMMGVYIFFTSLSMGGFLGAGYYVYNWNRGLPDEVAQIANYWIGWEYVATAVASIIITGIVWMIMKRHNILLLTEKDVLEVSE